MVLKDEWREERREERYVIQSIISFQYQVNWLI